MPSRSSCYGKDCQWQNKAEEFDYIEDENYDYDDDDDGNDDDQDGGNFDDEYDFDGGDSSYYDDARNVLNLRGDYERDYDDDDGDDDDNEPTQQGGDPSFMDGVLNMAIPFGLVAVKHGVQYLSSKRKKTTTKGKKKALSPRRRGTMTGGDGELDLESYWNSPDTNEHYSDYLTEQQMQPDVFNAPEPTYPTDQMGGSREEKQRDQDIALLFSKVQNSISNFIHGGAFERELVSLGGAKKKTPPAKKKKTPPAKKKAAAKKKTPAKKKAAAKKKTPAKKTPAKKKATSFFGF